MNFKKCMNINCSHRNEEQSITNFTKNKTKKDGLQDWCKDCFKIIREQRKEKDKEYKKQYYIQNKEIIREEQLVYRVFNREQILENKKLYEKSFSKFDTFYDRLIGIEEIRKTKDGYLETKCTYCGKWFKPTVSQVEKRIKSIYGKSSGELRLYCSDNCKLECPIYRKVKYSTDESARIKKYLSREVQPQLRQLVFERDNWTCIKCSKTTNLHCHHIESLKQNPIESCDIDNCITVCKSCHKDIHKQKGCRYHDLKCDKRLVAV